VLSVIVLSAVFTPAAPHGAKGAYEDESAEDAIDGTKPSEAENNHAVPDFTDMQFSPVNTTPPYAQCIAPHRVPATRGV
jgi:hypothetical protein